MAYDPSSDPLSDPLCEALAEAARSLPPQCDCEQCRAAGKTTAEAISATVDVQAGLVMIVLPEKNCTIVLPPEQGEAFGTAVVRAARVAALQREQMAAKSAAPRAVH